MGFFSLLLSVAIGFLMTPIVIHILGDRYYGIWTLATTFVGMFSLMDMGLNSAVSRHVAASLGKKDYEGLNRYVNTGFYLFTGIGAVSLFLSGCIALGMLFFMPAMKDVSLFSAVIVIMGAQFAIGLPINAICGLLTGSLRYDITTFLDITFKILNSTAVILVLFLGGRLLAMALASCLMALMERSFIYHFAKREVPQAEISRRFTSRGTMRELFGYSVYTFIAQIADQLRFRIPAFVVAGYITLSAVTHYNIATTLIAYYVSTVISFVVVLCPVFSRQQAQGDEAAIKKTLYFGLKVSTAIATFIGFGFVAWGNPFIERWMGVEYLDAYPCLVLLTIGYLTDLWQSPCIGLLYGTANHHFFALTNIIEGVANFCLSLALAFHFGMIGVAVGTMLPMIVIKLIFQPIFVCHVIKERLWNYYGRLAGSVGVCVLGLIGPSLVSYQWASANYPSLLFVGAVSACMYLPVVVTLGFTSNERQVVWNVFARRNRKASTRLSHDRDKDGNFRNERHARDRHC